MRIIRAIGVFALALATGLGAMTSALAQGYPSKPVRVVVPFTPGGALDVTGRILSEKLSEFWGKPVVVENRPGAGGSVGAGVVAKSPADGHTLLLHSQAYALNRAVYADLPYTTRDFVDVAAVASTPAVLVVGSSAGVRTIPELIAAAKAKAGHLNFGSAGTGTATHMVGEKFRLAAGIDVVHVPYKGGPEANIDTMTGRIAYWFPPIGIALPLAREGRLRILGVSSAQRSSLLPEVPTISEAGLSGFEESYWWGLWAPAGTPVDVADKIARDVARALDAPDVRDRLAKLGVEPMRMTPAEFSRLVKRELEDAVRTVKAVGITPQ